MEKLFDTFSDNIYVNKALVLRKEIINYAREHKVNDYSGEDILNSTDNMIKLSQDSTITVSHESWVHIQKLITTYRANSKNWLEGDVMAVKMQNDLQLIFKKAFNDVPNDKYGSIIKSLDLNYNIVISLICNHMHNLTLHNIQRKKTVNDVVYYKFTSLAIKIGGIIFKTYIDLSNLGLVLNKLITNKPFTNKERQEFEHLVQTILAENDTLDLYKNCWNINIRSNEVLELLDTYILLIAVRLILRDNIEFNYLDTIFKRYKDYSDLYEYKNLMNSLTFKIDKFYSHLGNIILSNLLNDKIFYEVNIDDATHLVFIEKLFYKLMLKESSYNPRLTLSKIELSKNSFIDNIDNFIISSENNEDFIHAKDYMVTTINKNSYLANDDLIECESKFTLDTDFFLIFLNSVVKFKNKRYNEILDLEDLYIFLSFFDIEFKSLCNNQIINKQHIIEDLITFGLNLDIISDEGLETKITTLDTDKSFVVFIKGIYRKMINYKIMLINIIREAFIYSLFNWWINDGFIDSRSRYYLKGHYLNVQSFPFIKSVVKYFNNMQESKIKSNFNDIKKSLTNYIQTSNIKQKILDLQYNDYKLIESNIIIDNLYAFLDPKIISRETFIVDFNKILKANLNNDLLKKYIYANIKKTNEFFIAYSYMLQELRKSKNVSNIYSMDATTSGLQQISIMLRSSRTAILSNLSGNEKTDMYKKVSDAMHEEIIELKSVIKTYTISENKEQSTLKDLVMLMVNYDVFNSFTIYNDFKKVYTELSPLLLKQGLNINTVVRKFNWLVVGGENKAYLKLSCELCPHNVDLQTFIKFIFILKGAIKFLNFFVEYPWILNGITRDTFKHSFMTIFYNSTPYGRLNYLKNYFKTLAVEKYGLFQVNYETFSHLCKCLESFFYSYITNNIEELFTLKDITDFVGNRNLPVYLKSPFVNILYMPVEKEKKHVTLYNIYGKRRYITLQEPKMNIDRFEFKKAFMPNFIHLMDATLVHYYRAKILNINKELKHKNLMLNFYTNHDCFSSNLLPFLKYLIRDCYFQLYDLNFLSYALKDLALIDRDVYNDLIKCIIEESSEDEYLSKDLINNPHFIKV